MTRLPQPGDLWASRYRIHRQIGRGGAAVVYEAHDERLDRPVAVKVVPGAGDEGNLYPLRFANEAQVQARVRSRHTVTIHEHGEHEDAAFLVTDLMPDGDLHTWLVREGPMPWRAALSVTAQVCEALEDTHRAGIVHRDVKPSNVLLWTRAEGLIAFLCDFGIATEIGDIEERRLNELGLVAGSPAYMAPERLMGTRGDDERGDVYSAGCVLWATLTGEAPYSGTALQLMSQHVSGPVPQLDTGDPVDEAIDAVLRRALAKDPDERFASAAELRHELRAIHTTVAGAPAMSGLHPVPPSLSSAALSVPSAPSVLSAAGDDTRSRRRRRAVGAVAAIVAAAIVGFVGVSQVLDAAGSSPTASPGTAATDSSTGEAGDDATANDLLSMLVAPRVRTTGEYRSVRFAYVAPEATPGAEVEVEYRRSGGWAPAPRDLVRRAPDGGRACVRARSVVLGTSGEIVRSPVRRFCDSPAEPVVRAQPSEAPCSVTVRGITYPCRWYDVRVAGFAPGSTPVVEVQPPSGPSYCTDPVPGSGFRCREVRVDGSGRGEITQYLRIARVTSVTLEVRDTTRRVTLTPA